MFFKKIRLSYLNIITILFFSFLSLYCNKPNLIKPFNYGTKSDSAQYYFEKGWQQIMDNGQWTLSEKSFRKAFSFDSNFVIGKSLVGRISTDLNERLDIYRDLELQKFRVKGYNRLLLDKYISNINIMNIREQNDRVDSAIFAIYLSLSELNSRKFVHKYPDETYIKAEYIEILHAKYGAKSALDSLKKLVTEKQKDIPFFINYSALLESELGNFNKALSIGKHLVAVLNNTIFPEQYMLFAQIYYDMDSLQTANKYIEKAVKLDPKHLIAQSLKKRIIQKLNSGKKPIH